MNKVNYSKVFVDRNELEALEDEIGRLNKELNVLMDEEFEAFRFRSWRGGLRYTNIIYFKDGELGKRLEDISTENVSLKTKLYYNESERGQIEEFNSLPWYKKMFYTFTLNEKDENNE